MTASFSSHTLASASSPPSDALDIVLGRSAELHAAGCVVEALALLDACDLAATPPVAAARAQLLNDLGRFAEAGAVAACALEADATRNDARFAQAFAHYMQELLPEAQRMLDALIAQDPGYPNAAWLRAGLLRRLRGELDPDVLTAYDLTLAVAPANLYARVERADLLRVNGRYEEALTAYTEVCAAAPDEPLFVEATFKQGCVALVLQQSALALAAFRTVLDHAPDYPEAREMYEMVGFRV